MLLDEFVFVHLNT